MGRPSAFPDLGDGTDAVLVLEVDDPDALGGPAERPDLVRRDADDLALDGDDQEVFFVKPFFTSKDAK